MILFYQLLFQFCYLILYSDLQRTIDKHLFHFKFYDFLWKDDMYAAYYDFIDNDPGTFAIKREVERLLHIEEKIQAVPRVLPVGPICLETRPITDALYGFAVQWKTQYAQVLHEEAKVCESTFMCN